MRNHYSRSDRERDELRARWAMTIFTVVVIVCCWAMGAGAIYVLLQLLEGVG